MWRLLPTWRRSWIQERTEQILLLLMASSIAQTSQQLLHHFIIGILKVQWGTTRFALLCNEVCQQRCDLLTEADSKVTGRHLPILRAICSFDAYLCSQLEIWFLLGGHEKLNAVATHLEDVWKSPQEGCRVRLAHGARVKAQAPMALELLLKVLHWHLLRLQRLLSCGVLHEPLQALVDPSDELRQPGNV